MSSSYLMIGTRMWRRGADSEGYVANFVETEQILQSKGFTASYVQVSFHLQQLHLPQWCYLAFRL